MSLHPAAPGQGYTLIELVVVMALLGVLLVFSIPKFRDALGANEFKSSTRRLIALVREVRNTAGRTHQDQVLHIEISRGRLWFGPRQMSAEAAAAAAQRAMMLPAGVRILDVCEGAVGKKSLEQAEVLFSRKGYIEQTMIHLEARDGDLASLLLTPFLGEIKVYDKYVEIEKPG